MKLSIIVVFLLYTQPLSMLADESIDAQIARIQQASDSERFQLVNELKRRIAQMNANQQARAIAKYQEQSLHVQQQANMANQILNNNQNQRTQDSEVITPKLPINKPNDRVPQKPKIPIDKPTIPTPKPTIPVQKPTTPTITKPSFPSKGRF